MKVEKRNGKTTNQIKNAPENSIFVWCNGDTEYPISIARKLGRNDLQVVSPSFLCSKKLRSIQKRIVIDHAAYPVLSSDQYDAVIELRQRLIDNQ